MNSPNREEIDAKLEALEARQDARVSIIATKLDALTQLVTDRFRHMDDRFGHANDRMSHLEMTVDATHTYLRNLKTTMFATALASVLGIAALNATVMSNMLAAFQAGKDNAAVQSEFKRQARDIDRALAELGRRSKAVDTSLAEIGQKSKAVDATLAQIGQQSKAVDATLAQIGQQSNKVNATLAEMRQTSRQMAATQAALQRQAGLPKQPRQ